MATTTTSNPASVGDRIQEYFSRKLLKIQVDELRLDQFAVKEKLPRNQGSKTIRFFKPSKANTGARTSGGTASHANGIYAKATNDYIVNELTEGTPISEFRENVFTYVDVTLKQYGAATKISDIMTAIDIFKPLQQNIDLMGREAALSTDTLIRNSIVGTGHPSGTGNGATHDSNDGCESVALSLTSIGFSNATADGSDRFDSLKALAVSASFATRLHVLANVTALKVKKAPRLRGGNYVCLLPPQISHDLMQNADYKTAFQGQGAKGPFKGSMGIIDGVEFVEHTNPLIEDETYGVYDSEDSSTAGLIYASIFLGAGAYGVPDLDGQSPWSPRVYVNDKPDKSDPANQFVVAAWKAFYMSQVLDRENLVVFRCKSTFA